MKLLTCKPPAHVMLHYHGEDGRDCLNIQQDIGQNFVMLFVDEEENEEVYNEIIEAGIIINEEHLTQTEYVERMQLAEQKQKEFAQRGMD